MPIAGIGGKEFPKIGTIRKGASKESGPLRKRDLGPVFRVIFNGTDERSLEARERFIATYGSLRPEEIDAIFTVDSPEESNTWRFWLEAYDKGAMVLQTDGKWIEYKRDRETGRAEVRRGRSVETGERMAYNGEPAYSYYSEKNKREISVFPKAHGYLRILVPALRRLAYLELRTTSFWDCDNIDKNLRAIAATHGSLKGIPCIIRRRLTPVSKPLPDGKRFFSDEWLIYIEAATEWVDDKFAQLRDGAYSPSYQHRSQLSEGSQQAEKFVDAEIVESAPVEQDNGEAAPKEPPPLTSATTKTPTRRPYSAEAVREGLRRKVEPDSGPVSQEQAVSLARKFQEAFAPAKDSAKRYHLSLTYLWGVGSAKELSKSQATVTLRTWLLGGNKPDSSGDTPLGQYASVEADNVYRAALKEAANMSLSNETSHDSS